MFFMLNNKNLIKMITTVKRITSTHKDGTEDIIEFDRDKRFIKFTHSNGRIVTYTFDEKYNLIYSEDISNDEWVRITYHPSSVDAIRTYERSDGYRLEKEYDESGRLIHITDSQGYECEIIFELDGRIEHKHSNDGEDIYTLYDENKNVLSIFTYNTYGGRIKYYFRDEHGNCIEKFELYGSWIEYEYDENNNLIYEIEVNDKKEKWYEYDKNGNLIHIKSNDGTFERFTFDDDNNIVHYIGSDGTEYKYNYEYREN